MKRILIIKTKTTREVVGRRITGLFFSPFFLTIRETILHHDAVNTLTYQKHEYIYLQGPFFLLTKTKVKWLQIIDKQSKITPMLWDLKNYIISIFFLNYYQPADQLIYNLERTSHLRCSNMILYLTIFYQQFFF